jgi:predicted DNA-binding ribbon-helix-helix protein
MGMKDPWIVPRNIYLPSGATSIRIEAELWECLEDIARRDGIKRQDLLARIYKKHHKQRSFSSSVRVYIALYYRNLLD